MPVKVRCPGCEKVLNAPDKARGKEVRCPKCETRVKIPARKKKKAVKQPAPDSDYGFLDLNLHEAEDRKSRICPACGEGISQEDMLCPACGVDVVTGKLPERELKLRRRGGPDPALYYKAAWSDSWDYMKKNKRLARRTFGYWVFLTLLLAGCAFMADYSEKTPPIVFWSVFTFLVALAFPGWLWSLAVKIIIASAAKAKLDRVNFDIFLNIAFGIKWLLWYVVFFLPASLLALPFLLVDQNAFYAVLVTLDILVLCIVPTAMAHMSMPVTLKAWLSPLLIPTALRNFGHSFWWVLILLTVLLVCFSPLAGAIIFYAGDIEDFVNNIVSPPEDEIVEPVKKRALPQEDAAAAEDSMLSRASLPLVPTIVLSTCFVLSHFLFSYGSLFLMRATGLYVYYNKQSLELVTSVKEKEYVARSIHATKDEAVMEAGQAGMSLLITSALGLAGGAVAAALVGGEVTFLRGIGTGLFFAGLILGLIGRWSMARAAFGVSANWGYMVIIVPLAETVFMLQYFKKAKYSGLLQFVGFLYIVAGIVMFLFGAPGKVGVDARNIVI